MKKIRLGVVGLGHMGTYHFSVSKNLNLASVTAAADIDPLKLEKAQSKTIFTSTNYKDITDHVDGVIIAVPTQQHYEVAQHFLSKGIHVLIEKPLTKKIIEAQSLFNLALRNNLSLHVGHVERFNGAISELKKIINKPYLIECDRIGPFAKRVQNDSVILDLMIHDLDIVFNLVNSEIAQSSIIGKNIKSSSCDIAVAQLVFKDGTLAIITSSRASQIKQRTMKIHQENEYIVLDFSQQAIQIHRQTNSQIAIEQDKLKYKQESLVENLMVYKENPLKLEIEYFIDSIINKRHLNDKENNLKTLSIIKQFEKELNI